MQQPISIFDTSILGKRTFDIPVSALNKPVKLTISVADTGNTGGNIMNGGIAAIHDGWVYYNNNGALYKSRLDGSEKTMLSGNGGNYINVVNGYVYYTDSSSYINKIKTDGTEGQQLNSSYSRDLTVIGDYIYYMDEGPSGLFRMKTDGTEQRQLFSKHMKNISIIGGNVIYNAITSSSGVASMYRMNLDGTGAVNYNADTVGNNSAFAVFDGWIYYNGSYGYYSNMGLYRIKLDGTDRTKLTSDSYIDYINPSGNYVYYATNRNQENAGIYRISIDEINNSTLVQNVIHGLNTPSSPVAGEKIVEDKAISINVVGDWIYYRSMADNRYYRVRTEGSQRQLVN